MRRLPVPRTKRGSSERESDLSGFIERLRDSEQRLYRYVLKRPKQAVTASHDLVRLRRLVVTVDPGSVEGAVIVRALAQRHTRRRFLLHASALELPSPPVGYADGPGRQTVRRMARKATARGITCEQVLDPARQRELMMQGDAWERGDSHPLYSNPAADNTVCLQYRHWLVAHDRDGQPIALSVTPVDGDSALLRYFRTIGAGTDQTLARYLMMQALADSLAEAGVRYLFDEISPFRLPNGLRHFQRMVGFRLFRVRVDTRQAMPASRALLAGSRSR